MNLFIVFQRYSIKIKIFTKLFLATDHYIFKAPPLNGINKAHIWLLCNFTFINVIAALLQYLGIGHLKF